MMDGLISVLQAIAVLLWCGAVISVPIGFRKHRRLGALAYFSALFVAGSVFVSLATILRALQ